MLYRNSYIWIFGLALAIVACEDPVEVPTDFEEPQLVIDAWLTNTSTPQTIRLSQTVDYFAGATPPAVETATVRVCREDTSNCRVFEHQGNGNYVWTPATGETFGAVNDLFLLEMEVDGQTYTSQTIIKRTAVLDSIGLTFEEESLQFDEGFVAQLYARDLPGRGDTYWVRAYKNDTLLNRPSEIVAVYDATFDPGADIDGTYWIPPLRLASVNPLDNDGSFIPYQSGDHIYVEVHSINEAAFRFLNIATEQIQNEGLFATPLANAPGNVIHTATGESILGIFTIAEVASMEREVE
ncbi:MAG: DUF4249 domain-containing protein [Bacteroidetes bacterium]|nr:MAG: DUF4249 domain-containing protein [Bacteroidota bacterium]